LPEATAAIVSSLVIVVAAVEAVVSLSLLPHATTPRLATAMAAITAMWLSFISSPS
jgi:hypothetical protein